MRLGGPADFVRALRERRPLAIAAAIVLVVAVVGTGAALTVAVSGRPSGGSAAAPAGSEVALATDTPGPTPTEAPSPTPAGWPTPAPTPTPIPTPASVAATTSGILLPPDQAALATRHPIAVMLDDHWLARPHSGLSQADIVYQAYAESGIPRYMAIFQTQDPPSVGPVRSSRFYFVTWAEEWRAMYVHVGGSPNALAYLPQINGKYVWNADEFKWGGNAGYLWRAKTRSAPHNVYTSGAKLQALAKRLGATEPYTKAPWTFADAVPADARPIGGTIAVPYRANSIVYHYDWATNTYPRSVTNEPAEIDAGNGQRIAPSNVIVLYQPVYALAGAEAMAHHRLDIKNVGHGRAVVFNNGTAIEAQWSKKSDSAPTLLTYASGPQKGQPVALVRGQIFVQSVPPDLKVTWTLGRTVAPPQY